MDFLLDLAFRLWNFQAKWLQFEERNCKAVRIGMCVCVCVCVRERERGFLCVMHKLQKKEMEREKKCKKIKDK